MPKTATVRQAASVEEAGSSQGFLLLDSDLNLIFFNPAAAQTLIYPQKIGTQRNLGAFLKTTVRSTLLSRQVSNVPAFVSKFQSGKRLYMCRAFGLNPLAKEDSQPSIAVLLNRGAERSISLRVWERFNLTPREQTVSQCLLEGLTSKEIAARMGISANTVKAFLRMIMLKMGATTRAGIVGKAYTDMSDEQQNPQESVTAFSGVQTDGPTTGAPQI